MNKSSIRYPKALKPGDTIGITAPSSGIKPDLQPRLDLVLSHLRSQGFKVVEGECLRSCHKHVSAPKETRAAELIRFWKDPEIKAIMPPWGGELLIEILPLLNFEDLSKSEPKWISGFSDVSTLLFALTLKTGIASLHGSNLMDLAPTQTDPLTTGLMRTMQLNSGESFKQESSPKFQKQRVDFRTTVDTPLNLTEPTEWKSLGSAQSSHERFSGRLIGGCLDTIARLVGTPYGDLSSFKQRYGQDGVIFYFENCELAPCELVRTLWNLRLAGWLDNLSGILIGRSSGPDASVPENLSYEEALRSVFEGVEVPIVFDADIGHRPPNLNLVNGAFAEVEFRGGKAEVTQMLV